MLMPFSSVTYQQINEELAFLSEGYDRSITTTSLRDIYHRVVDIRCNRDPTEMMKYTPHLNAKSISSSYLIGRETTQKVAKTKTPSKAAKKETAKKAKKPAVPVTKKKSTRK